MSDIEKTLELIDRFCSENSLSYAVVGGLAVVCYGSLRTTIDIDITILCEIDELTKIHNSLPEEFVPLVSDSLSFFSQNFVLPVIYKSLNTRVYVIAGLTRFDKDMISRRKRIKFKDVSFYVCSLEDLIIYKLFANRFQDIADIEELIKINKSHLDIKYLVNKVSEFEKIDRPDMLVTLNKFLKR